MASKRKRRGSPTFGRGVPLVSDKELLRTIGNDLRSFYADIIRQPLPQKIEAARDLLGFPRSVTGKRADRREDGRSPSSQANITVSTLIGNPLRLIASWSLKRGAASTGPDPI